MGGGRGGSGLLESGIGVASRIIDGLATQVLQSFWRGDSAIGIPWHLRRRRRQLQQNEGRYPHSSRHEMAPFKSPPWMRLACV